MDMDPKTDTNTAAGGSRRFSFHFFLAGLNLVLLAVCVIMLSGTAPAAQAQDGPTDPFKIVAPSSANSNPTVWVFTTTPEEEHLVVYEYSRGALNLTVSRNIHYDLIAPGLGEQKPSVKEVRKAVEDD